MRLEQRIERVHRGNRLKMSIFSNLATQGTIEEHIWRLLHEKNPKMFEMVVGQLDTILIQVHWISRLCHLIDIFIRSESEGAELVKELDQLADGILSGKEGSWPSQSLDLL